MKALMKRSRMRRWLPGLAGLGLFALTCPAATHYVVPPNTVGVTPADPYTSWETAGTNLQVVITAAQTNTAPRVVWITNGTYYLTGVINLTNAITVIGVNGYAHTIIDGNGPAYTNAAFNINMPANQTGVVDGLTITNCWRTGLEIGARAIVQNCLIVGNKRMVAPAFGGGIATIVNAIPTKIINCIVRNNTAATYGGGIYVAYNNTLIQDTLIEGNTLTGSEGGGGLCANVSTLVVTNCIFKSNSGSTAGGGIRLINSPNSFIYDSAFICNTAKYATTIYGSGGAIYADARSSFFMQNCVIVSNVAWNARGGGVYSLGKCTIRNSLFTGNTSKFDGGAIWCQTGLVENCTIVGNQAGVTNSGGGIYMDAANGSVTSLNNIIYFNTASNAANFINLQGDFNLAYSCVFPAVSGTGNTTNDPVFIDPAGGNYRLKAQSPCINGGLFQNWMPHAVDLDGGVRIQGGAVDMGAFEYKPRRGSMMMVR